MSCLVEWVWASSWCSNKPKANSLRQMWPFFQLALVFTVHSKVALCVYLFKKTSLSSLGNQRRVVCCCLFTPAWLHIRWQTHNLFITGSNQDLLQLPSGPVFNSLLLCWPLNWLLLISYTISWTSQPKRFNSCLFNDQILNDFYYNAGTKHHFTLL